jgi:hypothetical protein
MAQYTNRGVVLGVLSDLPLSMDSVVNAAL